ncbi:energy transducer TonB [Lysobacter sp. LF1]|uniref:Energy transducer TonB n=1 Tax=Lysobacter stagni TaxID=3045172 RepID=A0ABT6XHN7_9GAMM|nr:energy transducer TonB [Lysobacter sp. LF1]MDI9239662.1 energy transducer TonB [Lysobacter sp. LF1]
MSTLPRIAPFTAIVLALAACQPAQPPAPPVPTTELLAVDTPPPSYPEELLCDNVGGQVVLQLSIGTDGRPASVEVFRGSGVAALDKAALEGVRGWRFKPATRDGQPLTSKLQVPVNFHPPQVRPQSCFALDEQRRRSGG